MIGRKFYRTCKQMLFRISAFTLAGLLMMAIAPIWPAHAQLPYVTLIQQDGKVMLSPDAYMPAGVIRGFKNPEDLFITPAGDIYVADTGNDRVVRLNREGLVMDTIPRALKPEETSDMRNPKEKLRRPEGVFVTGEGEVIVADTGSKRLAVYNNAGQFIREYRAPDTKLVPETFVYSPSKVVMDQRGYLYIATKGGYQGLLQLTPEGEFVGFYGANKVDASWLDKMKRKFYSEEQLKEEKMKLPGAVTNMAVDSRGFLFTVNRDLKSGQLKRLSFGGHNLLPDRNFTDWAGPLKKTSFQDVFIDNNGMMAGIEAAEGWINVYNKEGRLLYRFGSDEQGSERLGMFKRPTSIVADSEGTLYVSDGELSMIQVFKRTQYGTFIHQAETLYDQGRYEESYQLWEHILRMNGVYDRAYLGIAKAQLKTGDYKAAMRSFEEASDRNGYSETFWQVRMEWLLRYFGVGMTTMLALLVLGIATRRLYILKWRKKPAIAMADVSGPTVFDSIGIHSRSWIVPWKRMGVMLRHPLKGMYEIAECTDAGWGFTLGFVLGGFAVTILGKATVGYLFASGRFEELDLRLEALTYFLPWLSWVIANYLTGSVMKGEGTFKKVALVNSYALAPYVLLILPLQWFSNVLTLQESILYNAGMVGIGLWVLILVFIGTQTVHNYNAKEASGMIAVSIGTLLCLWVFAFVLIGLIYQAADLFLELGREVMHRV